MLPDRTHDLLNPVRPDYADLVHLIEWLALPYSNGDPIFSYGRPDDTSEHRSRLEATWLAIIGHRGQSPGLNYWAVCNTCGMWQVVAPPLEGH